MAFMSEIRTVRAEEWRSEFWLHELESPRPVICQSVKVSINGGPEKKRLFMVTTSKVGFGVIISEPHEQQKLGFLTGVTANTKARTVELIYMDGTQVKLKGDTDFVIRLKDAAWRFIHRWSEFMKKFLQSRKPKSAKTKTGYQRAATDLPAADQKNEKKKDIHTHVMTKERINSPAKEMPPTTNKRKKPEDPTTSQGMGMDSKRRKTLEDHQ